MGKLVANRWSCHALSWCTDSKAKGLRIWSRVFCPKCFCWCGPSWPEYKQGKWDNFDHKFSKGQGCGTNLGYWLIVYLQKTCRRKYSSDNCKRLRLYWLEISLLKLLKNDGWFTNGRKRKLRDSYNLICNMTYCPKISFLKICTSVV